MKLIGLSGQFRNGKDEVADHLAKRLEWDRVSFASNVKRIYCDTFDVDLAFVEEWKNKPETPPGFDMPVRQGLQFIGDGFRKIQYNIWIDLAFRNPPETMILSDVRYVNELKRVRAEGGINILVYRPGFLNDDPNGSEAQIRPFVEFFVECGAEGPILESPGEMGLVDIFIRNDGTLEDLYAKVDRIVLPYVYERYTEKTA